MKGLSRSLNFSRPLDQRVTLGATSATNVSPVGGRGYFILFFIDADLPEPRTCFVVLLSEVHTQSTVCYTRTTVFGLEVFPFRMIQIPSRNVVVSATTTFIFSLLYCCFDTPRYKWYSTIQFFSCNLCQTYRPARWCIYTSTRM